jgi:hypothetical protein
VKITYALTALATAMIVASPLHAQETLAQPLTHSACQDAGQTWNESTNVCDSSDASVSVSVAEPVMGDSTVQPLTRAACNEAGMEWHESANVCGSKSRELNIAVVKSATVDTASQPLSRAACDEAGLGWNESANVCGVAAKGPMAQAAAPEVVAADTSVQPLTRADCSKAGMKWNESTNVCGEVKAATERAAPSPAKAQTAKGVERSKTAKKVERAKPKAAKATKRSAKKQTYTKTRSSYRRKAQAQPAPPMQRRPFRLFRKPNRPAGVQ